jgi:hypothetical protein
VDPDRVSAGDTLELQLMPNDGGSLSVRGRSGDGSWRDVWSQSVEALRTYITPPLNSGEKEFQVTLARRPLALNRVSLRDDQPGRGGAPQPSVVVQPSAAELATYVVTPSSSPLLLFTITVNYK